MLPTPFIRLATRSPSLSLRCAATAPLLSATILTLNLLRMRHPRPRPFKNSSARLEAQNIITARAAAPCLAHSTTIATRVRFTKSPVRLPAPSSAMPSTRSKLMANVSCASSNNHVGSPRSPKSSSTLWFKASSDTIIYVTLQTFCHPSWRFVFVHLLRPPGYCYDILTLLHD